MARQRKLTIAIPTYNRAMQIKNTVSKLRLQLTPDCFLLVIDNHSETPVTDVLKDIVAGLATDDYKISRNSINIGGDANIMRCFEMCETEWLWTLGDDDDITDDAVAIILSDIERYADTTNICYYSPHKLHPVRNEVKEFRGRKEFLSGIDSLGAYIFMSTNVYNRSKLLPAAFSKAYHNTYSCCAHWIILFSSLDNNSLTVRSNKVLCHNNADVAGFSAFALTIIRGFSTLFDASPDYDEATIIKEKLTWISKNWLRIDAILMILMVQYKKDYKSVHYFFSRAFNTYYRYCGLVNRVKYYVWSLLLLISPALTFAIIKYLYLKFKNVDINSYLK